jgi:hypothetical protein
MQTTGARNTPTSGSPKLPEQHRSAPQDTTRRSARGERGEGVISTAIAVCLELHLCREQRSTAA